MAEDCSGVSCLAIGDIAWTDYGLSVSGITDNASLCYCAEINGDWNLTYVGFAWDAADCSTLPDGCRCAVPAGPVWRLQCIDGVWNVFDYISGIIYVPDTFNPLDGGTFTKTGSAMWCDNLPDTITLTPAGTPFQCEASGRGFSIGFGGGFG
jgi:hypothetical protein